MVPYDSEERTWIVQYIPTGRVVHLPPGQPKPLSRREALELMIKMEGV